MIPCATFSFYLCFHGKPKFSSVSLQKLKLDKILENMRGRGARNNLVPNRKRKRPDHSGDRGGGGNQAGRVTGVTFKPRAPPAKNYMENYEPKNGCPLSYYIQSGDQFFLMLISLFMGNPLV